MTEEQRIASWSGPYCQRTRAIDAEKQLAIMTTKFNKMKQSRNKHRTENEELKKKLRMSISKDEYYTNTKSMELGFEIIRQEFKKQLKKAKEENQELFEELEYMKKEQKNFNGYMMDD